LRPSWPYAGERVGRAAAEHLGHVDPARDRDVRPRAGPEVAEVEHLAGPHVERLPRRLLLAVEPGRKLRAGDDDDRILGELELRAEVGRLEDCGALVVADEHVRDPVREVVHRARRRHAEVVEAEAARVLDRCRETAVGDADHDSSCATMSAL
jgi:hypothetical protein